jgi:hypothetical protein
MSAEPQVANTLFIPSLSPYRTTKPTPRSVLVERMKRQEAAADRMPVPIETKNSVRLNAERKLCVHINGEFLALTKGAARDLAGHVNLRSGTLNNLLEFGSDLLIADAFEEACRVNNRTVVVNTTNTKRRGRQDRIIDSVVTERYHHFPHSAALEALEGSIQDDAMVVDFSYSERMMVARISTEPFEYGKRMIAVDVRNSHTRNSSLSFGASDFNPVCSNGMVIVHENFGWVAYTHTRGMMQHILHGSKSGKTRPLSAALPEMLEASGMYIAFHEDLKTMPVEWSQAREQPEPIEANTPLEAFVRSPEGLSTELRMVGAALPDAETIKPLIVEGLTHETTDAQGTASSIIDAMTWASQRQSIRDRELTEKAAAKLLRSISEWRKGGREKIAVRRDGSLECVS